MKNIQFDLNNKKVSFSTNEMPSVLLDLIFLNTSKEDWGLRISNSYLNITFSCFDENNILLGKLVRSIRPTISVYQTQPVIFYNHASITFDMRQLFVNKEKCKNYETEIELLNIDLDEVETYNVQCHILEQTSYQLVCLGNILSTIFITNHHPDFIDKKIVTYIPVNTNRHSDSFTEMQFGKSEHLTFDNTMSDELIVNHIIMEKKIVCSGEVICVKF